MLSDRAQSKTKIDVSVDIARVEPNRHTEFGDSFVVLSDRIQSSSKIVVRAGNFFVGLDRQSEFCNRLILLSVGLELNA